MPSSGASFLSNINLWPVHCLIPSSWPEIWKPRPRREPLLCFQEIFKRIKIVPIFQMLLARCSLVVPEFRTTSGL